jgi:hypothetical protein
MKSPLVVLIAAASALAQQRVEIQIDKRENGAWKTVDPRHVFKNGDQVRFRFTSSQPGFLYVVNEGSSGEQATLFPSEQAGSDNRVEAGREYTVPAGAGAFRITGPRGYDTVYWIVSPVRISTAEPVKYKPLPDPPTGPRPPAGMSPRCDDTVFRARGDCVDHGAGLKPNALPGLKPRELFFARKGDQLIVSAPRLKVADDTPITYRFLIAHQ